MVRQYLYFMRIIPFVLVILILAGCQDTYDIPNHVPGVVKVSNGLLYAAYGEGGLIISDEVSRETLAHIFPPRGMNSIDDFDVEGDLIFAIDSRGRDYLAVFSYSKDQEPQLEASPIQVQGGPFNGISAKNGNLVVSGGTTFLNRFTYNPEGELSGPVTFGRDRGHPDVLLSENGQFAFISTDGPFEVERFGITSLYIGNGLEIPAIVSELEIPGSGFSIGVTKPVGFPIQSSIIDNHLLVAHGGGLTIIQLVEEGGFGSSFTLDIGLSGISVATEADRAYVIGYQNDTPSVVALDISDINNPAIISTVALNTNDIPTSIAIGMNRIYIAAGETGILQLLK